MSDLKTFKDIIDLTKNRINETETDDIIDTVVKQAINDAYINELSKYDKRITSAFLSVIKGIATLPEDIDTIENITPSLIGGERRVGNAILSNRTVTFSLIYSYVREPLVNDTDELDLSKKLMFLLSTYASYVYWEYKKKPDIAKLYLDEYSRKIANIIDNDKLGEETTVNVIDGEVSI